MVFALPLTPAVAPINAYAAAKNARAVAVEECVRQAKAKRLGSVQTIQRRNFLKDCMVDRGFNGGIN
jgi:hypothetical protein